MGVVLATEGAWHNSMGAEEQAAMATLRLAFRPPTPLTDASGNGASADHSIGHGDAVWTAIGDDRPP